MDLLYVIYISCIDLRMRCESFGNICGFLRKQIMSKKSGVTGVISHDQRRSKASCFLACRLVDIFN